ncbi:MAG: transposase [Gemmatimonadota bacterium]|nr:transposase [Gemmatimonadota bacterium]
MDDRDYLVVYLDGVQFASHHVLVALGVDAEGNKRILGIREGASENAAVALALLEELVERGLDPARARLFVIDGSKALRKAVGQVFGDACRVQRCRNHKMCNVLGHLPKTLHDQARAVLRAAWKLSKKEGKARIDQFASWVEKEHPAAWGSLREGLDELFTVSELGLTPSLRRCLGTRTSSTTPTPGCASGCAGSHTGEMARWFVRWAAASFMDAEQNYRKIMGYRDLWTLKAHLDELVTPVARKEVAS